MEDVEGHGMPDQLRARRQAFGLSQKQLADKIGVTQPALSQWENDETIPQASHLLALMKALSVDSAEALGYRFTPGVELANVIVVTARHRVP